MYLEHFGLERQPFCLTPDPGFLFLTAQHREALAGLLLAVTGRKGFLVLTGEAGTGKTTLVRKLLQSIPVACARFSVVVNPTLSPSEFLEYVLMDFGVADVPASKAMRLSLLRKLLLEAHREGKTSVLVVDEAHVLTPELLEEIRLLSNFEMSDQKLLLVILAGQKELNALLNRQSLAQLKQRIAIRLQIQPLDQQDVRRYLQTRWTRAGAKGPLPFGAEAIDMIARASRGIPRIINSICDAALLNAYGIGLLAVGESEIQEVVFDLQLSMADTAPSSGSSPAYSNGNGGVDVPAPVAVKPPAVVPQQEIVFKTLDRYMPETARGPKLFRWPNWFGFGSQNGN